MSNTVNWIHSKLEIILASFFGISSMAFNGEVIIKCVLAVVLGFLGAFGGWLFKFIVAKLKKK